MQVKDIEDSEQAALERKRERYQATADSFVYAAFTFSVLALSPYWLFRSLHSSHITNSLMDFPWWMSGCLLIMQVCGFIAFGAFMIGCKRYVFIALTMGLAGLAFYLGM